MSVILSIAFILAAFVLLALLALAVPSLHRSPAKLDRWTGFEGDARLP